MTWPTAIVERDTLDQGEVLMAHAVRQDRFTLALLAEQVAALPELEAACDLAPGPATDSPAALAQDIFALLYQGSPRLREPDGDVGAARRSHRALVGGLWACGGLHALRTLTVHDAFCAAVATSLLLPLLLAADGEQERAEPLLPEGVVDGVALACSRLEASAQAFAAWGFGPGRLQHLSPAERLRLASRLRTHRLAAFVDALGAWRLGAGRVRPDPEPADKAEVELADRLVDVLASERALLGSPVGRVEFAQRLAERRLLCLAREDNAPMARGPVIVLTDTSCSMRTRDVAGTSREAWAMGLTLAVLDRARVAGRDFVGIVFGAAGEQHLVRFPAGQASLDEVLDFASLAFRGGTDFMAPLDLALEQASCGSDLVLIADGGAWLEPEWLAGFHARRAALDCQVVAVAVGADGEHAEHTLGLLADRTLSTQTFTEPGRVGVSVLGGLR